MTDQNAAAAATDTACPISAYDQYDRDTAVAIDNAFDVAIQAVTNGAVMHGEFNGCDETKDRLVELMAAKAGFDELMESFQRAKDRIVDLEAQLAAPAHRLAIAKANLAEAELARITGAHDQCTFNEIRGSMTATSPEAIAERKLGGKMRGCLSVRHGDTAYDIEGTPEFIAAVPA